MLYVIVCTLTLVFAYLINISYMSVFYHRGLTHGAITFHPLMKKFVLATGVWMTGLDPKPWCCMHRMHHLYSDTEKDPHSPVNVGVFGVLWAQKIAFEAAMFGLMKGEEKYTSVVPDLDFPVNWNTRNNLFLAPYVLHGLIAGALGYFFGFGIGACYFVGMMSHPLQGWLVNSIGHFYGYRNFESPDNSKNNTLVALLVLGEGYQNNHHEKPQSATFAATKGEIDLGYYVCKGLAALGLIQIVSEPKTPIAISSLPSLNQ